MATRRVVKLSLVPYKSKQAATASDEGAIIADEDLIAMALVVHNESTGIEVMYVADWRSDSVVLPNTKMLRQLVRITPAIEAMYNELVQANETCLVEDLDSIPEGPELGEERHCLQFLVDKFTGHVCATIGVSKQRDKDINELITSLRTGEISNWSRDEERIKNVLLERLKFLTTVTKISHDIKSFIETDASRWKYLLEEAYKNG
ncbi:unnamed protein product [Miscanthus lutarioriparius]|uniref:Uncharacterized protein n=1 Tax=Miscanthus lutarioriparius TaxID=422564 RepID=A0A811NN98_9POAL|nr:unnamed protein product [Miscanthus lutarioriparius]